MGTDEKHFNELQLKTRAIASSWILAGFAGIAYAVNAREPALALFSAYTMITLVSLMVVVGLFVLWVQDQLIYQRLLNAHFVAGLYHEFRDAGVPPVRVMMIICSEYRGMARWHNLFYFIPMLTFTLFSSLSFLIELQTSGIEQDSTRASLLIGLALVCISCAIFCFIYSKNRQTPFINLLQAFADEDFAAISTPQKCAEIIRRWKAQPPQPRT